MEDVVCGLEVVVGLLGSRVGVEHSVALFNPVHELVHFRVLLTPSEQHVFQEVGKTSHLLRVVQTPYSHRQRRRRVLTLRVTYQNYRKRVRQNHIFVLFVVNLAFQFRIGIIEFRCVINNFTQVRSQLLVSLCLQLTQYVILRL